MPHAVLSLYGPLHVMNSHDPFLSFLFLLRLSLTLLHSPSHIVPASLASHCPRPDYALSLVFLLVSLTSLVTSQRPAHAYHDVKEDIVGSPNVVISWSICLIVALCEYAHGS
jgi:hypothetical protein